MERPAGAGQMPDFLGDAVHVDSQADPAIADQCEPEFPLFHGVESCRGRWTCRGCVSVPGKSGPAKAGAWAAWTNSRQPPDREIWVESGRSPSRLREGVRGWAGATSALFCNG